VVARIPAGQEADVFGAGERGSPVAPGRGWLSPGQVCGGAANLSFRSERTVFRTDVLLERVYYIVPGCQ
jgi:hypothetical protein